ncbi:ABC transporter, ATP-binding protein [Ruminococcus albus 8]|uniref:ABC transporter, ATP-binding protein n=2 Tax=Ruminococcus albus TaxID=1264 RepID=E9SC01_RUMAL|nr:ABC transporter ATP-binding protein [Ruminococcus albus]EGC03149.1 ABC transporter, ATP-binding protein [Ruminococcus albus 8]MCC3351987.1 ABC transporter ATP-binding protein/permease [Ruminococcus albus 8]
MEKKNSPFSMIMQYAGSYKRKYVCSVVLAVISVACGMVPYFAVAKMVTAMIGHEEKDMSFFVMWCAAAAVGYISKGIFNGISTSISHTATYLTMKEIRQRLISKLTKMPMGTILGSHSGHYKEVIVDRVESIEVPLAHLLPEMTANVLAPLLMLLYLFTLDWRLALISLITIPVGMAVMSTTMKSYGENYGRSVEIGGRMTNAIVEYMGGIEVIKAFSRSESSYEKYETAVNENAAFFYGWMKSAQWAMSAYNAITPSVLLTVLPFGFIFYASGSLTAGAFVTMIILSLGLLEPLIAAMNYTDNIARVSTVMGQINEVLESREINRTGKVTKMNGNTIEFRNVTFSYDNENDALKNIDLTIPEGKVTSLVGHSGSGKSTVAKLIAGFWDVTDGELIIGGQNVSDIPLEVQAEQIAYVEQNNFLFDETVMENIRKGKAGATDEEVVAAAKAAGCDEFIRGLDKGYQTVVGSAGGHLSGGERQRIAIARAMLKNAPIVILDEATAYIDPENEAVIQSAIAKLVQGKTVIVIAHRLSTITDADNIIVMENGTVSAHGRHDELLRHSQLYRSMWQAHTGTKGGAAE